MRTTMRIDADPRALPLLPVGRIELGRMLGRILDALDLAGTDFTLRVVDDWEIARLNEEFLGCVGPTNVLSFPAEQEGEGGEADDNDGVGWEAEGLDESATEDRSERAFSSAVVPGAFADAKDGDAIFDAAEDGDAYFDALEDDGAYLGDIALSAETLLREADLYGQDPTGHLARLLAHALLHLAGFDHGDVMDELTERAVEAAVHS